VVPFIAAVLIVVMLFLLIRKLRTMPAGAPRATRPVRSISQSPHRRPLAPDDDPEFLRELGRRMRRPTDDA